MLVHFITEFPTGRFKLELKGIDWKNLIDEKRNNNLIVKEGENYYSQGGTYLAEACCQISKIESMEEEFDVFREKIIDEKIYSAEDLKYVMEMATDE